MNPFHTDWDEHSDMAESAINDALQESVQETPFMLNYGQHPSNFLSLQTHSHMPTAADFMRICSRALHVPRTVWSVPSKGRKPTLTEVIGMPTMSR